MIEDKEEKKHFWPLFIRIEFSIIIIIIVIMVILGNYDLLKKGMLRHPDLADPLIRKAYGIDQMPTPAIMRDNRPPVFDDDGKEIDCYQPGGDKTGKCAERNRQLEMGR